MDIKDIGDQRIDKSFIPSFLGCGVDETQDRGHPALLRRISPLPMGDSNEVNSWLSVLRTIL